MLRSFAFLSIFLLALCNTSFAAADQWVEVSSQHFTVVTDSNDKQARHVLDQLESMRWMFHTLFPKANVDPAIPIVVFAVKNEKSFRALEPAAYLAKGQLNLNGLFLRSPDKNYVLLRLDAVGEHPYATIYHEYTHLQFGAAREWIPLWFNEGYAEFIQNTEIRDKNVLLGEPSSDDILYLRQNRLMPLATLFNVDQKSPYYHEEQKGSVFYSESWALTHYLEISDRQKGTHQLLTYLTLVSQHEDPVTAAEKAFGNLKQLQSALEDYIHADSYKQFVISITEGALDRSSYQSRTLTQSEADALRADVLVYVNRAQEARPLLDAVLKADPKNAQAHETMGYLAFHDHDLNAARSWYQQAVQLGSKSFLAHYYFATLSMGDPDSAENPAIEASFRTAIRLNSEFAPAYENLANLLSRQYDKRDEAFSLISRAVHLEPDNLAYRIDKANVLVAMGQYLDAASFLRDSIAAMKDPRDAAILRARAKQLDAMQAMSDQASAASSSSASAKVMATDNTTQLAVDEKPRHPDGPPVGAKHLAIGVIRAVACSYPSVIDFRIDTGKKAVRLYSNNYFKMDISALGFTPEKELHPCEDLKGMKAQVQYTESPDKTVDGQVVSIVLKK